jgi:transcriptional regulator with XRE-family HTH domain
VGFSERLKAERLKKGLKQRELAGLVKTTNTSVSNWEKGLSRPSAAVISLLAQALEISPFDLLGDYTLKDIKELDSRNPAELGFEDSMALVFSVDAIKDLGNEINTTLSGVDEQLNRNMREIGTAVQNACRDILLADGGEKLLLAYASLNSKAKILLLEYLSGLLKVPAYLAEPEFGVDEAQISVLSEVQRMLENPDTSSN